MSTSPLPFGLSSVFRPLSRSTAETRLKSNLFALFLFSLKGVVPPYVALRGGLVRAADTLQGRKGREGSWGEAGVYIVELIITSILLFNALEAVVAIQYPRYTPGPKNENRDGLVMTPVKVSSPLTRVYSPSKPSSTATTPNSQPLSQSQSSQSLQRSIFRPSPSPSAALQQSQTPSRPQPQSQGQTQFQTPPKNTSTPHPLSASTSRPANASPLSSSTAKILNLNLDSSQGGSPVKSQGLFFDKSQSQAQAQAQSTGGAGGDFVLVDREEKEWVDNVWKGVRGKGGKVGL